MSIHASDRVDPIVDWLDMWQQLRLWDFRGVVLLVFAVFHQDHLLAKLANVVSLPLCIIVVQMYLVGKELKTRHIAQVLHSV